MNKQERMEEVALKVASLDSLDLVSYRKQHNYVPVIGQGNLDSDIMFVGEAPGKNEAVSGTPFCGRSGAVLDILLESVGLERKKVYITNIVKDRPPENRDPTPDEIALYAPFLDSQIDIIQPKVIATLGRISMKYILERYGKSFELKTISDLHGMLHEAKPEYGFLKILPLYHPAVAVYNVNKLALLKDDFTVLKNAI